MLPPWNVRLLFYLSWLGEDKFADKFECVASHARIEHCENAQFACTHLRRPTRLVTASQQ
jgi:hypothetical protein